MMFLTGILTNIVTSMDATDVARQIANAHTIFNIVNVIVLFPFANLLLKLADIIVPEPKVELIEVEEKPTSYLDKRILVTPSIALQNTMYEFAAMSHAADQTLTYAIDAIRLRSQEKIEKAFASEQQVNQFQKAIVEYLVEISQQNVSTTDQETIDELFSTANDVERISDHAENIADFAKAVLERDIVLDEKTLSELEHVFELVQKGFAMSIDTLSTGNLVKVKEVITIEREIDRLKIEIRDKYMKRMNKGIASAESGIFVMDLLSNLERISDHFRNIGETVQRLGRPVVVTE